MAIARGTDVSPSAAAGEHIAAAVDLVKIYQQGQAQIRALDGVTVGFARARFTAIAGPSGSGKSTLMHCLAGLDSPTSGQAVLEGTELSGLSDRALTRVRRDKVGFVFQSFNLLPQLTALENIALPVTMSGRRLDQDLLDHLVGVLGIGDRMAHRPGELSGGQQQRVALARALVARPAVVFADEPTGNLDSRSGTEVLDFLRRSVRDLGQTVVMVTHDPRAAAYADRVLVLADGRIVDDVDAAAGADVTRALRTAGRAR
ncbi:ABC transporter ATP-binding protein [Streptomyces bluensis]|uniref:ABC transporter ATP-binding protein n=1 Tax=Streptomyces bluensis TaxID=33897 RepID=UPI0010633403|nr:ABC transporter ATP-binding protein [Streptomyces bluensis]GGZ80712.1 ABC transporter ATP-binding protein [Streptomyces bluensis]